MSQQDSMGGLILTHSQEMSLFTDPDVGSIMTLLNTNLQSQQQQQQALLYSNMYEVEHFQVNQTEQKIFQDALLNQDDSNQNGLIEYPPLPALTPPIMPIPPAVISNEEYAGPFNFDVFIDPHLGSKNPWVFSAMLNKLFITMNNSFPIDFKWDLPVKNLYVRATPLFSLAQHAQDLVTRCIPHTLPSDASNRNIPQDIWDHVIRCQSQNAQYCGNVEKKIHLNVLVPLGVPQTGMDTVRLMYSFVCKNSCPSGMNRKPFEVIFTLEDEAANVYGRKKVNVRVCSCPKRDKEKEEKDYQKEMDENPAPPPTGKKRKAERNDKKPPVPSAETPLDTKEYPVNFNICGKHNQRLLLKLGFDLMAGEIARHGPNENLQKCLNNISEQLQKLD